MQATTWIDRISDESNLWMGANKCEDQRDFAQAVKLYLRDASDCLARGAAQRAALSCSCAADCLSRLGLPDQGRALYREAALAYLEGSESRTDSVREMFWCLKEAWVQFQLAEDSDSAAAVLSRLSTLSRRTDPFPSRPVFLTRPGRVQELEKVDPSAPSARAEVEPAIKRFLEARRSGRYELHEPARPVAPRKKGARTSANEKSIINQLG